MKKNAVVSLTINNESPDGQTCGVARIEMSYKNEGVTLVSKEVASAHCMKLYRKILLNQWIFLQMSRCALSHNTNTSCLVGNLYFDCEPDDVEANIAAAIGEFWCKKITGGMGSYCTFDAEPLHHIPLEVTNPLGTTNKARDNSIKSV